jgi:hypothetical protein
MKVFDTGDQATNKPKGEEQSNLLLAQEPMVIRFNTLALPVVVTA